MKAVAYYRVSTQKQGQSGLGLQAQQQAVQQFCQQHGYTLVASYTEVESGKRDKNRPELHSAIAHAAQEQATLIVAKLDRLSRNVNFLTTLMENCTKFKALDIPEADEFTVHIMAALAQKERKLISERTKAALTAAKARGVKLGNPNGAAALRRASKGNCGGEARARQSQEFAERLRLLLTPMRNMQLIDIAAALNSAGVKSAKGGRWHASSVRNVLRRL